MFPIVSVIIPVYNSEPYLFECLDSVCKQTLKDIEIICVNDGSTDQSLNILQKFSEQDKRIYMINQKNQGTSYSRNVGARNAKGKYIYFLDCDDYIAHNALEILACKMESGNLDILLFNTKVFGEEGVEEGRLQNDIKYFRRIHKYPSVCRGEDLFKLLIDNREYIASVNTLLISNKFLQANSLKFQEGITHEDELYIFKCLLLADRAGYTKDIFYFRRVRQNSIMDLKQSEKMIFSVFSCFICLKQILQFCNSITFKEENEGAILSKIEGLVVTCRNRYGTLDAADRLKVIEMAAKDKLFFRAWILALYNTNESIKKLKADINRDIDRIRQLEDEVKKKTAFLQEENAKMLEKVSKLQSTNVEVLKKLDRCQKKSGKLEQDLNNIKSGWSFRLGRILTYIPRKIKTGIKKSIFNS